MAVFKNFPSMIRVVFVTLFSIVSTFGAAGKVDKSFKGYLARVGLGNVSQSIIQPDGKIIIIGTFKMVNGFPQNGINRLNADGTLDTTFNPPVISGSLFAIGLQSNGQIVISGFFDQINGVARQAIARLNSDGSPDTAFNSNTGLNNIAVIYDLKISSDDKIVWGGIKNGNIYTIARLNADGSLNAETTVESVFRVEIQSDGKILYHVNNTSIKRLNQDLSADNTFSTVTVNNAVYWLKALPDGKTLISGIFTQVNGTSAPRVVRINANGSIDVSFVVNMTGVPGGPILDLPNGKIIIPGDNGTLVLRNSDGTPDPSFAASTNLNNGISDLDLQPDGKIVISGSATGDNIARTLVIRLNANGSTDTSFQTAIGDFANGGKVVVLPDNKFFVAGGFNYASGVPRYNLARFNANGTIDTTFNQNVIDSLIGFDIFPNGKVIAVNGNNIIRLNADGTQDIVFPDIVLQSSVRDIKALPDGRVLLAKNNNLERYNTDGTRDTSFNVPANGAIFKIALQADGKIVIGGNFSQVNGIDRSKISRLNGDGTLDTSFNSPTGGIDGTVTNVVLQSDGKPVIAGTFTGISFNTRGGLARLNTDGSLDTGFVPPTSFSLDTVKVQSDGKVLLGGPIVRCRRLNANGSIDTGFVCIPTTYNSSDTARVRGIDQQSDGKIIIVGDFFRVNGVLAPGIARLFNTSKDIFDYDGDGRSDVSVFRASENKWYVLKSSDSTVVQQIFAIAGDVPVPADYDGDGKTDYAIFRLSSGDWWYLSSINNAQMQTHWGGNGDIPRPSDFDGDGKADFVVFRPAENNWYRFGSTGAVSIVNFGSAGDKPVVGDFDGDSKSDVAIYRPSTGDWWWQSSVDNIQRATRWGIATDIPTPADFDGDGKTDFAVYRATTGVWYIINSSNGSVTIMNFGIAEDKPVPADYDGDGKADIAVFRPSTGIWYLMRSTAGFTALQFGVSTDIPTQNSFVP